MVEGSSRFKLLAVGQSIMAVALPLSIFSPPKTVQIYFDASQRTIMNTAITLGMELIYLLNSYFFVRFSVLLDVRLFYVYKKKLY